MFENGDLPSHLEKLAVRLHLRELCVRGAQLPDLTRCLSGLGPAFRRAVGVRWAEGG